MTKPLAPKSFCYLIGSGSLLIICAEIILKNNSFEILGLITNDQDLDSWAKQRNISLHHQQQELKPILAQQAFDYLFSINNPHFISAELLKLPKRCAINYHDSPLPRYAGLHATSWGIMAQEKEWAISWHVMEERLDTGAILKQPIFSIGADETAFTLNGKCFEEAIAAFDALIGELADGETQPVEQDLSKRSYFSASKRPEHGGVINFAQTAAEIHALIRALDFGFYPNPLGLPKLAIGASFYAVRSMQIRHTGTKAKPGTLLEILEDSLKIAVADDEVSIGKLQTLSGSAMAISDIVSLHGIRVGMTLAQPPMELISRISELSQKIAKHEHFWLERLTQQAPLNFPPQSSLKPAKQSLHSIPVRLSGVVNDYAQSQDFTLRQVLQAAFAVTLSRITGRTKFDLAYVPAKLTDMTGGKEGFFAGQVPWPIVSQPDDSFGDVCRRMQRERQLLADKQTYALDLIIRQPKLSKYAGLADFKSFAAIVESAQISGIGNGLVLCAPFDSQNRDSAFATLVYDPARCSQESAQRLLGYMQVLLAGVAAVPDMAIKELPLLTSQELEKIRNDWIATEVEYPSKRCIHELFEDHALTAPDATAVVYAGQQLSYGELNAEANRLAGHLRKLGVGPDSLVGICVKRGLNMMVGLLGVLKAGGAYLPLDPSYPQDRLELILKDSRPLVLLAEKSTETVVAGLAAGIPHLCLSSDAAQWQDNFCGNLARHETGLTSENLAYIIYTSGSTGKPKGVMIEHHTLVNLLVWYQFKFEVKPTDRASQLASFGFDACVWEIWPNLTAGASVHLIDNNLAGYLPADIQNWLAANQISIAFVPTPLGEQIIRHAWPENTALRWLQVAGDVLRQYPIAGLPFKVANVYGPTECTVVVTFAEITAEDNPRRLPSIGSAISNTRIYILDASGQLAPIGVAGELFIGGVSVARGYLNRPDLTAERFLSDPFSKKPNARMYKTGDIGCWLEDGNIEFLGRNDHQVKIRGYRIELGEIESVLLQYPGVCEAVVIVTEHGAEKRLVAYYTCGEVLSAEALRSHLKVFLPEYMTPAAFVHLQTLPLTANGKLDRKALPEPDGEAYSARKYAAPENEIESAIAQIWADLLKVKQIGRHDDFFELGGHSLLAASLIAEINQKFRTNQPLATVFNSPTVQEMARLFSAGANRDILYSIFPLQGKGSKPFLFWFEPNSEQAAYLTGGLGTDYPVYGLRYGMGAFPESAITLPDTIEQWAAHYVEQIRLVQPQGPYHLFGHCYGGLLAYETARQLTHLGERIENLYLVDVYRQGVKFTRKILPLKTLLDKFMTNPTIYTAAAKRLILNFQGKDKAVSQEMQNKPAYRPDEFNPDLIWPYINQYKPQKYSGPLTLLYSDRVDLRYQAGNLKINIEPPEFAWKPLVSENLLTVHHVPGDHVTILKQDGVEAIAKIIKKDMALYDFQWIEKYNLDCISVHPEPVEG
jgi:amino acid adenylation domain-containing protein